MAILKKIALTGLLAAVGLVAYRFLRIVVRVFRAEFPRKSAETTAK